MKAESMCFPPKMLLLRAYLIQLMILLKILTFTFSYKDELCYEEKINLIKEAGVFLSKLLTPK